MSKAGDFWVGDRLVRPSLGEIRLGLEKVRLGPRPLSVLTVLAEQPRVVISKNELIERVWQGSFVNDDALAHAIWDLRRALGDNAANPEFIQTIHKRGYRLIAPVRPAEPEDLSEIIKPTLEQPEAEPREVERGEPETGPTTRSGSRLTVLLGAAGVLVVLAAFWWGRSARGPEALQIRQARDEIERNELSRDPDVSPFLLDEDVDPRAQRDYLDGLWIQYRNEKGAEAAMRAAMERAPDFVAPWVFQAGPAYMRGDPEEIRHLRLNLERLLFTATGFENAMIQWALAVLDGSPAQQVRFLTLARRNEPVNRLVSLQLAVAYRQLGQPDKAWTELRPLVERQWRFPGLYTLAAVCAIERGTVEDLERTLEKARENETIDPEILDLLRILSIYREDSAGEKRFEMELARRIEEMAPEKYDFDSGQIVELLARRADDSGRTDLARRLRESGD